VSLHQLRGLCYFLCDFYRHCTKNYGSEKQKEKETGRATSKVYTSCTDCYENPKKRKQWTDEHVLVHQTILLFAKKVDKLLCKN